jgi:hypothetical protein
MINFPYWCTEAWVLTDALHQLGFDSERIFFGYIDVQSVGECVVVYLAEQGNEPSFTWTVAPEPGQNREDVCATWLDFVNQVNHATPNERSAIRTTSTIERAGGIDLALLTRVLWQHGIRPPARPPINARGSRLAS